MRAIFEQFDSVVDFPHVHSARIQERDGKTFVSIYDAEQTKQIYETDAFTSWDRLPNLKQLAIDAYVHTNTRASITSHMSRRNSADLFRRLASVMFDAGLVDRSPSTLTFFDCEDVLGCIAAKEYQNPEALVTPLRQMVAEIWRDPSFDGVRDPHLFVRRAPFPGTARSGSSREILADAAFGDLYARAAADCAAIMERVRAFRHALAASPGKPEAPGNHLRTATDCAIWLHRTYGDALPSKKGLRRSTPGALAAVVRAGGWKEVISLIHPTTLQLMPFIALLGCQGQFNKAVLTEMGLGDIKRTTISGTNRIVMTPMKERAGRQQLRSFPIDEAPDNPDVIVRFLEDYTAGVRRLIASEFKDRLLLFWSLAKRQHADDEPGPSAFAGTTTGSGSEDSRFSYAWRTWCKEAKLGDIQFSEIRATAFNLGHRLFGGDVRAIAAMGSHSSPEVFEHHYKSHQARSRNDRRMGKAMLLRERMLASGGKIDPTRRLRGEGVQGATPGFSCLDPCASPVAGQREGRPCSAYGQCPDCPLATTDIRAPANLARMKQVEAEYVAASGYLAPHYWRDKYLRQLQSLRTEWLPLFNNAEVIEQAARMRARALPPLG